MMENKIAGFLRVIGCVVGTICLQAGIVQASDRQVEALKFDEAPVIDGVLDDASWQKGVWYGDFVSANPGGGKPKAQTRFKIGVDAHHLYLAAILEKKGGGALVAGVTERDGPVWRDDALEVMIDPAPTVDQYIHFLVNPNGVVYDALRVQGGNLADATVDLSMDLAIQETPDAWYVEISLPLAELGLSQETAEEWAINVVRGAREGGAQELSNFAGVVGDLHRPHLFAKMLVKDLDVNPFFWALSIQGTPRVVKEGEQLFLEININVANQTRSYVFFELLAIVHRADEMLGDYSETLGLDAGTSRLLPLKIPVDGDGAAILDVSLFDASAQSLLARMQNAMDVSYTPMRLTLTTPAYRDTIYATQKVDKIAGRLENNLPEEELAASTLLLSLEKATGEEITQAEMTQLQSKMDFSLPLEAELPLGSYRLVARLLGADGAENYELVKEINRIGPPTGGGREVRLDENRITLVDGKPFLPFGAMSIRPAEDLAVVSGQGYTAILEYSFFWWDEARQKAWLDGIHELGLMALIYPFPEPKMTRDGRPRQPLSKEEEENIRGFVTKWKDHPAILAWYLTDEPELHSFLPERVQQIHELCRELDPYHPTIVLNNTFGGIDTYGEYCDILMPNPFPGFYKGRGARRNIEYAYRLVRHAEEAAGKQKGIWSAPQAFSWADLREARQNERPPSFVDMRSMFYQGVIAGGTGFVPYAYQHGRRHPSIRLGLAYLAREMDLVKPGILAPEVSSKLESSGTVLHSLREGQGNYYLFVANVTESPQTIDVTLPEGLPGRWFVLSEGKTVTAERGHLKDKLDKLAVRIYTTDEAAAKALSLEKAADAIAKAPVLDDPEGPLPEQEKVAAVKRR